MPPADVITISSSYGTQGNRIANLVGEMLSIPVHDQAIVTQIASAAHVLPATVETIDETAESRIDDYLDALLREKSFDQHDYFRVLSQVIVALWNRGPCVLVGHGAQYLIPADHRLAVRLLAPPTLRAQTIAQDKRVDEATARHEVKEKDAQREAFIRHFFHAHIDDPLAHDIVINTAHLSAAAAATAIVGAFLHRFAASLAPESGIAVA